jgi:hypothetical protein
MTAPDRPKLSWRDRRRAKPEERKRREGDRAYRDLAGTGRGGKGGASEADGGHGGEGGSMPGGTGIGGM